MGEGEREKGMERKTEMEKERRGGKRDISYL